MTAAHSGTVSAHLARAWLARILDTTAAELRALRHDPALKQFPVGFPGLTPPAAPTPAELETAAATLARLAVCLRRIGRGVVT